MKLNNALIYLTAMIFLTASLNSTVLARVVQVGDRIFFEYIDADAESVSLAGTFNAWDTEADPMIETSEGVWRTEKKLKPGRYRFKYFIDGASWALDNAAYSEENDGIEDSVIVVIPSAESVEPANGVKFTFRSETAETVSVVGSFNNWDPEASPLANPSGDGSWEIKLFISPGTYPYMFVIDGIEWRSDPQAENKKSDGFGGTNSVITVQ